jgi:1,4-dihydroxy-2-naphthoate octaprenyltransferase
VANQDIVFPDQLIFLQNKCQGYEIPTFASFENFLGNILGNKFFNFSVWVKAARLRTLPLALAVSGTGNLLASYYAQFQWDIVFFSILTTLLLQILSNFANDLGDSIHGADHQDRQGPIRAVQAGLVTKELMKRAVYVFGLISLLSGLYLLWISFNSDLEKLLPVFLIGLCSIAAAFFYTNGKKPYGYQALGDISVFIFFGLIAILGTSYLHIKNISWVLLLPAVSFGFWSTAVLNINNMRDIESDQSAGKETIPIKLGIDSAKIYHAFLVITGVLVLLFYIFFTGRFEFFGFFPGSFIMIKSLFNVWKSTGPFELDKQLKPQALGTFFAFFGMLLGRLFFA